MTRSRELGEIAAPLLVFGGPYGNLEATRAVLAEAARLSIPPSRTLCTGDVVAYCADPRATVELVRRAGIVVVMGNCEDALGRGAEDCGCGFDEGGTCDRLAARWYAHAASALDDEARRWMSGLPHRVRFTMAGRSLVAVHGAVSRMNRFVFESTPPHDKLAEIAAGRCDGVIAGHSGLPFSQLIDGRLWHNAGVVGMPANDGTPRGWYSVLAPDGAGIVVAHKAFGYDHEAAAAKIERRGLPRAYARALRTGLWDNCEILPPGEIGRRGAPLVESSLLWRRGGDRRIAS